MCALLDAPVYDGNYVESLHLLFTLYMEFKENPHFAGLSETAGHGHGGGASGEGAGGGDGEVARFS